MGGLMNIGPDEHGLVGRESELTRIGSFVGGLGDRGDTLIVSGEPGAGKTMLLDAGAAVAHAAGHNVVRAAGVRLETGLPYSALHQLLFPLSERFAGLSGPQRDALAAAVGIDAGPAPAHQVIADAVLALLGLATVTQPLLVIVDDLPWVDPDSAAVLGHVVRRTAGRRAGFLGAMRPGLDSFFDHAGLPELGLGPLADAAADGLLGRRSPELSAGSRERVRAEARGNPLMLLELPVPPGDARVAAALPRRLREIFTPQIRALTSSARRLLLVIALDASAEPAVPSAAGSTDLAELERAHLLYVDAGTGRVTFRHPLIRSAALVNAGGPELRAAHRRLAALFADDPDRCAWHLAEATVWPDESVAGLLEQSARSLLRQGDAVRAVAALQRAAELSPGGNDRSRRLTQAAYLGADLAGDLRHAAELLADQRDNEVSTRGSLEVAVAAAHVMLNGDGDIEAAHRLLAGAITDLGDADDATLEEALYTLTLICFFGGRAALWTPLRGALAVLGSRVPTVVRLSSETLADPARTSAAGLRRLDSSITALAGEERPARIIRVALAGQFVDRLADCQEALWRVAHRRNDRGVLASALNSRMLLSRAAFSAGRWDEAWQLADEAAADCREHGYVLLAWPGRHVLALIAAARGDDEQADAAAQEMLRWADPRGAHLVQCYAWQVQLLAAMGRGDFEQAYHHGSKISPAGTLASHAPYALMVQLDLVEAAVRAGHQDAASAHVDAIRRAGTDRLSPRLALLAYGAAALVAPDEEAPALFELALAVPGATRWPFDLARVTLLYGERLRRARAVTEARALLLAAKEEFGRLAAAPWARRAGAELRATGWPAPDSALTAPALTPQESEVARLAASGLRNKQIGERLFLSPRTVKFHLHHVYSKLGVGSRAALRDAMAQRLP